MTPPDIDAIKALLAKATPGPWSVERDHADPESGYGEITGPGQMGSRLVIAKLCGSLTHRGVYADAHFIVAAVNSLPSLLAALAATREALKACVVPIEALGATECDESGKALCAHLKESILEAAVALRTALSPRAEG